MRIKPALLNNSQYVRDDQGEDPRFRDNLVAIQAIATSHGQNDSGMFELNFRDERYLPFEGAGVESHWKLQMPPECNAFDFNTISDIVMHIKYTAREGGEALRTVAIATAMPTTGVCLLSACHEFPGEWYKFLNPGGNMSGQRFDFDLGPGHFPYILKGSTLKINQVEIFAQMSDKSGISQVNTIKLTLPPWDGQQQYSKTINLFNYPLYQGILHGIYDADSAGPLGNYSIENRDLLSLEIQGISSGNDTYEYVLKPGNVKDLIIVCRYELCQN